MRVTNNILEIIDSITMDSILAITGKGYCKDKYKIVKASDNSLDVVTTTAPKIVWDGSFETVEEIKNCLVSDIALGKIKEIDVLNKTGEK